MPLPKENARYTYADYYTWDDSERWELIEGVPYAMSPAPTQAHQMISRELSGQLWEYLKGKSCELFSAPFDVRLNADEEDDTVVQPDVMVVCDHTKLDGKCCKGAPDLVMEVLSPTTARHDRVVKFQLYQRAGVREYWVVDPETKSVQVFLLREGLYVAHIYPDTETAVPVDVLDGCTIDLSDVFSKI